MGAQSEFDLLGLFRGRGLAHRGAVEETGELPNMIWLYRRPLLDFWCEGEDTLAAVVTHVLVHEIGHHFGLSDADMEAIETLGPLKRFGSFAAQETCEASENRGFWAPSQGRHAHCRVMRRPDSDLRRVRRTEDGASL